MARFCASALSSLLTVRSYLPTAATHTAGNRYGLTSSLAASSSSPAPSSALLPSWSKPPLELLLPTTDSVGRQAPWPPARLISCPANLHTLDFDAVEGRLQVRRCAHDGKANALTPFPTLPRKLQSATAEVAALATRSAGRWVPARGCMILLGVRTTAPTGSYDATVRLRVLPARVSREGGDRQVVIFNKATQGTAVVVVARRRPGTYDGNV